jgi:hypothetical protein
VTLVWGLPLALGLGVLVGGPVLAHLIRRTPQLRRAFGAMLLLRRLPRELRRRKHVEDTGLLFLRMLMVAAVVLAVASPVLQWPGAIPEFGGTGAVVVVIDDSMSMDLREADAGTLLSRARADAVSIVRSLPAGTLVGVVRVGGDAERLTPGLISDHGAVIAQVEGITQTPYGTDLAGGIRHARQMLAGAGGEVLVFTDEAGVGVIDNALPEVALLTEQGGALVPRPIYAESPENVAVIGAQYGSGPEGGTVTVEVANYGATAQEVPSTLRLPDGTEISGFIQIEPGAAVKKRFTIPRVAQGGIGTIQIDDGRLAADDLASFHLPTVGASRVLVVDGDPGLTPVASEVYYLERALAPWGRTASLTGGVLPDITSPSGVNMLDSALHRVVFLANVADPAPWANRLVEFVNQGGSVVISLGSNVSADRTNGVLAPLLPTALRRPRSLAGPGEKGIPTQTPDVSIPFFTPFARGGLGGFQRIQWQQLFTVEPYKESDSVRTLLRLHNGMPLMIERRVGDGRVILFTGTFDTDWGTLPLQAVFMPMIQSMVAVLGVPTDEAGQRKEGIVGQPIELSVPGSLAKIRVLAPSGPVTAVMEAGVVRFTPKEPGAHRVVGPAGPALVEVAVNVDTTESDVRRYASLAETAAQVDPDRFMKRVKVAPWALWLALLLALIQAIYSIWKQRPEEARHAG